MTPSHSNAGTPSPYLFGLSLTFEQLKELAYHYLGQQFVDQKCLGDPAHAFDRNWEDRGINNVIVEIQDKHGSSRYLYILAVLPSFDGKAPQADLKPYLLENLWHELGKPEAWKQVSVVSRKWPTDPGLPEPEWLYTRMYEALERMQSE
ncbi:hypothetical protein VKT23_019939 [Stygiomarasmius scandens]|uniref:Uncharacterized protein n=1 Tax=Marasmiellus scandens TaxID=2682957 RepID=A0ABR1IMB5_9AGAR